MPQFDLSTLPAQELRQLLDSARQRGQAAQSYEILQELATRRTRGEPKLPKRPKRRRSPDPRVIVLDLGDPLDREPELDEQEDALPPGEEPPLRLADPPHRPQQEEPPPPPAIIRQRWGHWATLCFAVGLGGGVAMGWWAADGGQWEPPAVRRPAPVPPPVAAPAAKPLPVVVSDVSAPNALPPASPANAAETGNASAAAASPQIASVIDAPPAQEAPAVESASAKPAVVAAAAPPPSPQAAPSDACARELTPADRTICGAPKLRRLQAQLRQAYADALTAHEDRALLRQRELAWRDGRNALTDPEQLAGIYRQRIAQLRAATMDAERQHAGSPRAQHPHQASNPARSQGA